MDNPRLYLWIALALLVWMNIIQWDRDYGAARRRRDGCIERDGDRRGAAARGHRPRPVARLPSPTAPAATAAAAADAARRRPPPSLPRRAQRPRRHRRARPGHQPAGRRPAARRPAAVSAGQEAGQPARAPAVHGRCHVRRRAQRPARRRRPRRADAPRDRHDAGREYRLAQGAAGTARAADLDGRAGPHGHEDLRLPPRPVLASTSIYDVQNASAHRLERRVVPAVRASRLLAEAARCSTSRATRSAGRPSTTARSTRSSTSTTRTTCVQPAVHQRLDGRDAAPLRRRRRAAEGRGLRLHAAAEGSHSLLSYRGPLKALPAGASAHVHREAVRRPEAAGATAAGRPEARAHGRLRQAHDPREPAVLAAASRSTGSSRTGASRSSS